MRLKIAFMLITLSVLLCGVVSASVPNVPTPQSTAEYMIEHATVDTAKEVFNLPGNTVQYIVENPEESLETAKYVFNYPGNTIREIIEH